MNKNRALIAGLTILALLSGCRTVKQDQVIPFADRKYRLLSGKVDGQVIPFEQQGTDSFVVQFNQKKFRNFDGSIQLSGSAADTSSPFYTKIPYTSFYHFSSPNKIRSRWFSKISWSMDFSKKKYGWAIRQLLATDAALAEAGDKLFFFSENAPADTLMILRLIR